MKASPVALLERQLVDTKPAQPLAAGALQKAQIAGVIDHAAGIRVFPIHPDRPAENFARLSDIIRLRAGNRSAACGLARWRRQAQVTPTLRTDHAAARRTDQVTLLDQVGFDHVFQRAAILAERGSQRLDADRTAVESSR
jgi:hypothetical protein